MLFQNPPPQSARLYGFGDTIAVPIVGIDCTPIGIDSAGETEQARLVDR